MKTFLQNLFLILAPVFAEAVEQSIISANNHFAADAYKELVKTEKSNFLVSPFSAETVLAFAHSGARGQTAEELRSGLRLPHDQKEIEDGFKKLFPKLKSGDGHYSFQSANKLYLAKNLAIKDGFKKTALDTFNSDLENVEFSKKVEAAGIINQWVEGKTQKKIHDLVDPEILSPDSVAVLVNAVYFKGNWTFGFYGPEKSKFYKNDGTEDEVVFIHLFRENEYLAFFESKDLDAKFLELPFEGENVSMVFVLPNEKTGLAKLEQQIDKVLSTQIFTKKIVDIALPKFKFESKTDFKEILKNVGVKKAFAPGADFSGISDGPLVLSDVIQKTFIDLNEKGVEAAGATGAHEMYMSAGDEEPTLFRADHPFIFYIKINNVIVFVGRVVAPSY